VSQFGSILEVQIRTMEMHYVAKYGVAAHWRYKGTERDKKFDKRISWLEQILDWKRKASSDFLDSLKVDLFQDEIVVFTPKGDPIILPEGSTPIDFAYDVHTGIGDHCLKAEVNKKLVSFDTKLKSGDIIRIITSNNAKPSRNWLSFVKTNKAKSKIRSKLGVDVDLSDHTDSKELSNNINIKKYISIKGKRGPIKISKCCNPEFKQEIVAYRTKGNTITIHKKDCPNVHSLDQNKIIPVKWNIPDKNIKTFQIYTKDKIGLIEIILNSLAEAKINVLSINLKDRGNTMLLTLKIDAESSDVVEKTKDILTNISEVGTVKIKQ
jgi:GTP pyrophosphokinase